MDGNSNQIKTYHDLLNMSLECLESDRMFKECVVNCPLSNKDLAVKMQMSLPTVERWRSGETTPFPVMRRGIYKWLLKNINNFDMIV